MRRWQETARVAGHLVVVLLVGACSTAGLGPSPADLDERTFLSTTVVKDGRTRPLVAGTRIRLTFDAGRIAASAGCNEMGADYRLLDGQLIIERLATTEMGCDPARHDQDAWLAAFLGGRPAVRLAGDDLVLEREGTTVELVDRRVADPDRPLAGPTWRVESIIVGQTVSSVPAGAVASLTFHLDGRIDVDTGCNAGGGTYRVEGSSIRLAEISLTKRACPGPVGDLEQSILAVLATDPIAYAIEANVLSISAGERGLGLRADEDPAA